MRGGEERGGALSNNINDVKIYQLDGFQIPGIDSGLEFRRVPTHWLGPFNRLLCRLANTQ